MSTESNKRKPVVGEILVRWRPKNRQSGEEICDVRVIKVSKKYFNVETVEGGYKYDGEFAIDDWGRKDTGHNERRNFPLWIFESREQIDEHKATIRDRNRLNEWRREWGLSVTDDQVRRILAIIDETP